MEQMAKGTLGQRRKALNEKQTQKRKEGQSFSR